MAILALLAGCGSGGDSTTSSADTFAADANAICKDLRDRGEAIPRATSNSEVKPYLDRVVPLTSDVISKLEDLTPAEDQKAKVDAWIATLKEQQTELEDAARTAETDPVQAVQDLQTRYSQLNVKGGSQARALGLNECGKGSTGGSSG